MRKITLTSLAVLTLAMAAAVPAMARDYGDRSHCRPGHFCNHNPFRFNHREVRHDRRDDRRHDRRDDRRDDRHDRRDDHRNHR